EKKNRFGIIDRKTGTKQAGKMIDLVGITARDDTLVEQLDPSNQSLVELAKALTWDPKYLLIDEITASLYKSQVEHVFDLLRKFAAEGMGILFVSHRLDEVFSLCSGATILRSGKTVIDISLGGVTEDDLVYYMTGERTEDLKNPVKQAERTIKSKDAVLSVLDFSVDPRVHDVSLDIYPGEIVGIAGLQGQGQSEFLRALYGYTKMSKGSVKLNGKPVNLHSTSQAIQAGIGFLPGDREREGVFSRRPLSENLFAAKDSIRPALAFDSMHSRASDSQEIIDTLHVVASGPFAPARSLSGGNQQKIIVGRWLVMDLNVLILDDPTKGVDISSRREIHSLLRKMTDNGVAMIYSSSDNEELLEICDRIVVFFDGRIIKALTKEQMSPEMLASATLGVGGNRGAVGS
nr:sugar ABC transporter ATP-binding protein [Spirochaetales bacterium]